MGKGILRRPDSSSSDPLTHPRTSDLGSQKGRDAHVHDSATSRLRGAGRPCAITVDSRATTGAPVSSARCTTGEISSGSIAYVTRRRMRACTRSRLRSGSVGPSTSTVMLAVARPDINAFSRELSSRSAVNAPAANASRANGAPTAAPASTTKRCAAAGAASTSRRRRRGSTSNLSR